MMDSMRERVYNTGTRNLRMILSIMADPQLGGRRPVFDGRELSPPVLVELGDVACEALRARGALTVGDMELLTSIKSAMQGHAVGSDSTTRETP